MSCGCADRQTDRRMYTAVHTHSHTGTHGSPITPIHPTPSHTPSIHSPSISHGHPSIHPSVRPSIDTQKGKYVPRRPASQASTQRKNVHRQTDRKADSWTDILTYTPRDLHARKSVSQSVSQGRGVGCCGVVWRGVSCVFGHGCVWESDVNMVVWCRVFCGYQSASRS